MVLVIKNSSFLWEISQLKEQSTDKAGSNFVHRSHLFWLLLVSDDVILSLKCIFVNVFYEASVSDMNNHTVSEVACHTVVSDLQK